MGKKGSAKKTIIAIICLISVLIIALIIYFLSSQNSPVRNFIEKTAGFEKPFDYVPESEKDVDIRDVPDVPTGSSGGGSGGGGSSSSSSSGSGGSPESNCSTQEISYSLEDPDKIETCNKYNGIICEDKTVSCSIKIRNRDQNLAGLFKVSMTFIPNGETNSVGAKNIEISINPLNSYTFTDSINIQSIGQSGNANKAINCFYNTVEVPVGEIC
ncbi:MAG: hypothetical protein AABW50_02655 [Nanoarchaeota archaeon]